VFVYCAFANLGFSGNFFNRYQFPVGTAEKGQGRVENFTFPAIEFPCFSFLDAHRFEAPNK
jgi:hypothetical protein